MFNSFIVTGIKKAKLEKSIHLDALDMTFHSFGEFMQFIIKNNTGSDVIVKTVQKELNNFQEEYYDFFKSIILREINLGVGRTSINKIMGKDFIPKFEVMLAEKYTDHSHLVEGREFIITLKLDGNRCVAFYDEDGGIELKTRQGLDYEGLDHIVEDIRKYLIPGYVYDGELIAVTDEKLSTGELYRLTTGLLHRDEDDKTAIKFFIFDSLTTEEFRSGKSKDGAFFRKTRVAELLDKKDIRHLVNVPILYRGKDTSVIQRMLDEVTEAGGEGLMINISEAPYECKRVRTLLKCKKFNTADVLVDLVKEGSKSFTGTMGQIRVKFIYQGQECVSYVGSGFSLEERKLYWEHPELLIGKVVEVGYFEISQNDKTKEYSLRFPTWKGIIREDKSELADLNL
jgi:DNA ligase 1